ncbi:hypothetical protein [Blastococcus sp. CT_GayMR16]|uniref:hypothetical protein n=1 Tax=Blastococcus sp. CT_GayMR16 TaxID=2559607 RepID=UPI001073FFF5|nr:hypothetical protein [Blastococcus sp. CT_GayMR16]TFV91380.1 hypothetical protein E4P38_01985 [Blastococcus sp. CT_GayMR16]
MTAKDTNVGKQTEQLAARWLRDHGGFPHAERTVRTGYKTANRQLIDAGDIDGCPGLVIQCKSLRPADRAERSVAGWLLETETQRQAVDAHVGVLVVRRWGTTDVGRWWCFFTAGAFVHLTGGRSEQFAGPDVVPLRLEVRHAFALLALRGLGDAA